MVLLWIFVLFRWRPRLALLSVFVSILTVFLLEIPYLFLDAEYALSFFFEMFGPFVSWLPLDFLTISPRTVETSSFFSFVLNEGRLKMAIQVFATFFHLWALWLFGVLALFTQGRKQFWSFVRAHYLFVFSVALTLVLFLAHFFFGPNRHKMYSLYFLPFLIFAAGYAANFLLVQLRERNLWEPVRRPLTLLVVAVLAVVPISIALSGNDTIFFNRWDYQDTDLQRIKRGGEYLASLTKADDLILTLDNPDHVLLASRFMIPARLNRHDVYADRPDERLLARFNFYNPPMFLRWLEDEADVFVAQKDARVARLEPIAGGRDLVAEVGKILAEKYELVGSVAGVYPRKEERGAGVLEVYRRRPIKK